MQQFDIEKKLEEITQLLEKDGFWPLIQRDRSSWGSIYILLCLPPLSFSKPARKTSYSLRVADHPPKPSRQPTLVGLIHPGHDDVKRVWKQAKEAMRVDYAAKQKEADIEIGKTEQYHAYRAARKKHR